MSTGAWGQPEYGDADPMAGDDQIVAASRYARDVGVRHFASQAALIAATGMLDGYLAVVDALPGALFVYVASITTWRMTGVPEFGTAAAPLTASAISAAITTPVTGMRAKVVTSLGPITYRYNGSAWKEWESDWITYTSTLSGFVLGSGGTNFTQYRYEQGTVRVPFLFVFGSSGQTFPTDPKFTLPVNHAALSHAYEQFAGFATLNDLSAASLPREAVVFANAGSVTQVVLYILGTATTGLAANMSPTSPWTWAVGDLIRGELTYLPA